MHECRVYGYMNRSMSTLYDGNRTCVKFGSRVRKYYDLRMRLRQRHVISLWLFNIFFDRVVRLVNEWVTGN